SRSDSSMRAGGLGFFPIPAEPGRRAWRTSRDLNDVTRSARVVMLDAGVALAVIAGLLVVVAISQPLAARLRLPSSVLLAAIGVAIGGFPLVLHLVGLSGPLEASLDLFAHLPVHSRTLIFPFF